MGFHLFSAEAIRFRVSVNRGGFVLPEVRRAHFLEIGPYVLASTPGGREELRRVVDPEFAKLVDEIQPQELPTVWSGFTVSTTVAGIDVASSVTYLRIDDAHGQFAGFCSLGKPRQECRTSPRRPQPPTRHISNDCGLSSTPIGAPRRS